MMRTIRLYGRLAKFLKRRVFQVEVSSAAEAVRFLVTNFPQLEKHMAEQYYRVSVDNYDLGKDELHHPAGAEIKIIPVVAGAGNVGRILLGIALIALSFVSFGATGAFAGIGAKAVGSGVLFSVGATLFLGGVAGLYHQCHGYKTIPIKIRVSRIASVASSKHQDKAYLCQSFTERRLSALS